MDFKDAFDLVLKQSAVVNEYWKFYSTVALAILAATIGSDKLKSTRIGIGALLAGFWIFSIGNLSAIAKGHALTLSLAEVANQVARATPLLTGLQTKLPSVGEVCGFHVLCDLGLTAAVLVVARHAWHQPPTAP